MGKFVKVLSLLFVVVLLLSMGTNFILAAPSDTVSVGANALVDGDDNDDVDSSGQSSSLVSNYTLNFVSGASLEDDSYVWHAGGNNDPGHKLIYRINYGLFGKDSFEPGALEIMIPAHIMFLNDSVADVFDIALPEASTVDKDNEDVAVVWEQSGDKVRIYNRLALTASESGSFEFSYATDRLTSDYEDGFKTDKVTSSIRVVQKNDTFSDTREFQPVTFDTQASVISTVKHSPTLYSSWQSSWRMDKPADADAYFYLVWRIESEVSVSQKYQFRIDDSFVTTEGEVVGYRFSGRGRYVTDNFVDNQILTEREDYVLTRHARDAYQGLEYYNMINRVVSRVIPTSDADEETAVSDTKQWYYQRPLYSGTGGTVWTHKYGVFGDDTDLNRLRLVYDSERISDYSLDKLQSGEKSSIDNLKFYSVLTCYPGGWSVANGRSSADWHNLNTARVNYTVYDNELYINSTIDDFNNKTEKKLSPESYDFRGVQLKYKLYNGNYNEDIADFDTELTHDYTEDDKIDIYVYVNSDWVFVGTWHCLTESWSDINSEYVTGTDAFLLHFTEGVKGYKAVASFNYYYVDFELMPIVSLLNSTEVLSAIDGREKVFFANRHNVEISREDGRVVWTRRTDGKGATDYIVKTERSSSLKTTVESSDNDKINRNAIVSWKTEVKDTYRQNDGLHYVLQPSGTFYILLPKGSTVNKNSVKLWLGEKQAPDGTYSCDVISDYNNSGQVLLKVRADIETSSSYSVSYDTISTWDSLKDYGKVLKVEAVYETDNYLITDGRPDDGGNLTHKDILSNLDSSSSGDKFIYRETNYDVSVLAASSIGLTLKVKAEDDVNYSKSASVYQNGKYSYQYRIANDSETRSKDLVFFDSLEDYNNDGAESDWHGTLQRIDTSNLTSHNIRAVVYYSDIEGLDLKLHHDLKEKLDGDYIWKTADDFGDISNAKAFAVDCRRNTNGDKFILDRNESLSFVAYMKAPADIDTDSELPSAYNRMFLNNTTMTETGDEFPAFTEYVYTTVEARVVGDILIDKINSSSKEPIQGITFRLSGTSQYGTIVDDIRVTSSNGQLNFKNVERGSYVLEEIDCGRDYLKNIESVNVTINSDGSTSIDLPKKDGRYVITNKPRVHGDLVFYKVDNTGDSMRRLRNARFRLYGTSSYGNDVLMYATSDVNGQVYFENIELGTYTLTEVDVPDGYIDKHTKYEVTCNKLGSFEFEGLESDDDGVFYVENEPYESFSVVKRDETNSSMVLSSAEFTLTGSSDRGTSVSMTEITDGNGIATFDNLEVGSYILKETKAPDNYQTSDKTYIVNVKHGNITIDGLEYDSNLNAFTVMNERELNGQIKITKIWKDNLTNADREVPKIHLSTEEEKNPEPIARISQTKWMVYLGNGYDSTNTLYQSVKRVEPAPSGLTKEQVIAKNGVKVDDDATQRSVYVYTEGTTMYYWTDAKEAYFSAPHSLFSRCPKLEYVDFRGINVRPHANTPGNNSFANMFLNCSALKTVLFNPNMRTGHILDMSRMFEGCSKLEVIDGFQNWDTHSVTTMERMFYNCHNLSYSDFSMWDMSSVTTISHMFYHYGENKAGTFTLNTSGWNMPKLTLADSAFHYSCPATIDVRGWKTPKLSNMGYLFSGYDNNKDKCVVTKIYGVEDLDVHSVTTAPSVFAWQCNLVQDDGVLDLSAWGLSNVDSLREFFLNCSSLSKIDISGWDTSSVKLLHATFYGCKSLTDIVGIGDLDTGMCTDMACMFDGCSSLESLDLSGYDTSSCVQMYNMFDACPSLTRLDLSGWDTSNVTSFSCMFHADYLLAEIKGIENWNTSSCTDMTKMFYANYVLDGLDLSNFDMSKVTTTTYMFAGCKTYTTIGDTSGWHFDNLVDASYMFNNNVKLKSVDFSNAGFAKATSLKGLFNACANLISVGDTSSWSLSNVTTLEEAFNNCMVLSEIDVSTWDVSSVTNLKRTFAYCKALSVIDVSNWHTGKLANIEFMFIHCESVKHLEPLYFDMSACKFVAQCFDHCTKLEYCDVGNWDAKEVRSLYNMWYACYSLEELDLSGFDTSHMPTNSVNHNVFSGCVELHTIYASESLKFLSTQDCSNLFSSCYSIVGENGTIYDASHESDYSYACIDTDAHPGYFTYKTPHSYIAAQTSNGSSAAPTGALVSLHNNLFSDVDLVSVVSDDTPEIEPDTVVTKKSDLVSTGASQNVNYVSDDSKWKKDGDVWTYTFDVFDDTATYWFYEDYIDGYSSDGYWDKKVQIDGSVSKEFSFTNMAEGYVEPPEIKYGSLKLTKVVDGNNVVRENGKAIGDFVFTITLDGTPDLIEGRHIYGDTVFVDGVATVTLSDTETCLMTDIPAGLDYTIKENEYDGYTTSKVGDTGLILPDIQSVCTFTNTKENIIERNSWTLAQTNTFGGRLNYTVSLTGLEPLMGYKLSDGTVFAADSEGFADVDLSLTGVSSVKFLDLPIGSTYQVKQHADSDSVASYVVSDAVSLNAIKSTKGENAVVNESLETARETVDSLEDVTVLFRNEIPVPIVPVKDIHINKQWVGRYSDIDSVTVMLYQDDNVYDSAELNRDNDWSYVFKNVPANTEGGTVYEYSVKEAFVPGFNVEYSGSYRSGRFEVTNTRVATGNIRITEAVRGTAADTDKPFKVVIRLADENGKPVNGTFEYDGTKTGTLVFVDGEASIMLKHDDEMFIRSVPAGYKYNIIQNQDMVYVLESDEQYLGVIEADSTAYAPFVNMLNNTTSLTIKKFAVTQNILSLRLYTIRVHLYDDTEPVSGSYPAKINGSATTVTFENGEAVLLLRADDVYVIENLEVGLDYTVTEDAISGWIQSVQHGSDYLHKNLNDNVVSVCNIYMNSHLKQIVNSTMENSVSATISDSSVDYRLTFESFGSLAMYDAGYRVSSLVLTDMPASGIDIDEDSFYCSISGRAGSTNFVVGTSSDIDVTKVGNDYKIELGESLLNMRDLYGNYSLSVCYTGTLNDDAVPGKQGNINTARYTLHTNTGESFTSSDSSADTYTFGMTVRKFDTGGSAVEGAEFAVYGSDADARSGHNPLGTGRTDTDGLCVFVKSDGTKAHFRNGTYYIVETATPDGYNRYTDVITVPMNIRYSEICVNGSFITNCPDNGVMAVQVRNSKAIVPDTGGIGGFYGFGIAGIALCVAVFAALMLAKQYKKRNDMS